MAAHNDKVTLDFVKHVKKVLTDELQRDDKFLSASDLATLLDESQTEVSGPRESIVGYPTYPLYREIGNMLALWLKNKRCPSLDLPKFDLLDDKSYEAVKEGMVATITPLLLGLSSLHEMWTDDEISFRVREILVQLGLRGILDLLGLRKTVGTKDLLPPARKALTSAFTALNNPKSELTVGARALTKHFHRDHSEGWWVAAAGSEATKNKHALSVIERILEGAAWINVHWLPHDVFILEARQGEGYGARWSADAKEFRGFLEPQMEGGHEVGWRH